MLIFKRDLILLVILSTSIVLGSDVLGIKNAKPNIIIILADDMGYGDCGVYNPESKIKTPHIDQLAKEGLRFMDAHAASSTCTPSRYGLLTGVDPSRTGVLNTLLKRGAPIIAEDETTIATLLKDQGYITKMIGKWHLGFDMDTSGKKPVFDFSKPLIGGPIDHGFDSFFGIHSSIGSSPMFYIRDREAVVPPTKPVTWTQVKSGRKSQVKVIAAEGFLFEEASPSFCKEAVETIRAHAISTEGKPLFLYYASSAPHQPWVPTKDFKGKSKVGLYGDFIMQVDDVLGQINTALKETGLDQNTILIFTSDNGAGPGAVSEMSIQGHDSSGSLRGSKASSWEGGHRIPFVLKWPSTVSANTETNAVINFTDCFATFANLLDVDLEQNYSGQAVDSYSFFPIIEDFSSKHTRPSMVHRLGAIREGDWKLGSGGKTLIKSKMELYNLADDIAETNDLSDVYPERREQLFKKHQIFIKNRKLK